MNSFVIAFLGGILGMLGYGSADFLAKKVIDSLGVLRSLFFTQLITSVFLCLFLLADAGLPVFSTANFLWLAGFALIDTLGYLCLYRAFQVGKIILLGVERAWARTAVQQDESGQILDAQAAVLEFI